MDCYFDRSIRKVSSFRIPYEEERLTMFPSFPASQRLWIMGRWWTTVFKTIRLFWCSNFSSFLITFFTVERGKSKKGFFFFSFGGWKTVHHASLAWSAVGCCWRGHGEGSNIDRGKNRAPSLLCTDGPCIGPPTAASKVATASVGPPAAPPPFRRRSGKYTRDYFSPSSLFF